MTPNLIGWIGAALFVGGLIGIGMLIENLRQNYKLKRKDYTFGRKSIRRRYKPRKRPLQPEEWAIQRHEDMQTPSALARQFVEGKE